MVEITTGAFDLTPGPSLTGVIDHERALGARPQIITVIDPLSQLAGHPPPIDVLATQEIVEHTDLANQNLAQFGAEAVDGVDFHQRPDQQGTKDIGQRFSVGAAPAADGGTEAENHAVTAENQRPRGQNFAHFIATRSVHSIAIVMHQLRICEDLNGSVDFEVATTILMRYGIAGKGEG